VNAHATVRLPGGAHDRGETVRAVAAAED